MALFGRSALFISFAVLALTACGGGGGGSTNPAAGLTPGFSQTYTASAGAGEVLQISVDTINMTYGYTVIQSSYGVTLGKTSTGTLMSKNSEGSYNISSSQDGFIQSGKVFAVQNGLLVGHVQITATGFDGTQKIPVFGVSNPITTLAALADTYNYQGFGCNVPSGGNVLLPSVTCAAHYGTVKVDAYGSFSICKGANISAGTTGCASLKTGIITQTATPGVYDFVNSTTGHSGWFFAFTAPNGQKVAVIDHDEINNYGHAVASTQISVVAGEVNGNYFAKDNHGGQALLTVNGANFTNHTNGNTGTLVYDTPWIGMVTHTKTGSTTADGIEMLAGTGLFSGVNNNDPTGFTIGLRY